MSLSQQPVQAGSVRCWLLDDDGGDSDDYTQHCVAQKMGKVLRGKGFKLRLHERRSTFKDCL